MLPFHEIDKDSVPHEFDKQFGHNVLGLDESLLTADGARDTRQCDSD
jgi:hypothetical protein